MARNVVPIRLDPDEIAKLDAAAKRHDLTRTAFIRLAALSYADDPSQLGRPTGKHSRPRKPAASAPCRHGLSDCRVCHTGRYQT